jgi:putative effector of murein hydrolase LrgA (UPF0299 family)
MTSPSAATWQERQRLLFIGAPLSLISALLFLPAVLYLVVTPKVPHAAAIALVTLPALLIAGVVGLSRLLHCIARRNFDLLSALAVGTLAILFVVTAYTALFLIALAAGI